MVELLSVWRGKLPSKQPQLAASLGNDRSLEGNREAEPRTTLRREDPKLRVPVPEKGMWLVCHMGALMRLLVFCNNTNKRASTLSHRRMEQRESWNFFVHVQIIKQE